MAFWSKAGSVAFDALLKDQFKELKQDLKADLDRMEERLGKRIDEVEERLGKRIDKVETRLQAHEDKCVERHGENKKLEGSIETLLALAQASQHRRLGTDLDSGETPAS